jgi:hypothetical protein
MILILLLVYEAFLSCKELFIALAIYRPHCCLWMVQSWTPSSKVDACRLVMGSDRTVSSFNA